MRKYTGFWCFKLLHLLSKLLALLTCRIKVKTLADIILSGLGPLGSILFALELVFEVGLWSLILSRSNTSFNPISFGVGIRSGVARIILSSQCAEFKSYFLWSWYSKAIGFFVQLRNSPVSILFPLELVFEDGPGCNSHCFNSSFQSYFLWSWYSKATTAARTANRWFTSFNPISFGVGIRSLFRGGLLHSWWKKFQSYFLWSWYSKSH